MSLSDFEEKITSQYGIKGEKMIDELCERFHELGFIAYFKDNSMKHVVLNAQKLIDGIACVISNGVSCEKKELHEEVLEYNRSGILSRRLLNELWESDERLKLSKSECEVFCQFLLKLNLMVEESDGLSGSTPMEKIKYIVPAMLMRSNEKMSSIRFTFHHNVAYFNLIDKNSGSRVYPMGVFYRLLAKTCAVTQLTSNFKPILSRSEAIVAVAETFVHLVSDAKNCRIKMVINSRTPSGIIYLFEIFVMEVVRDYFPEMGYVVDVEIGVGVGVGGSEKVGLVNLLESKESLKSGKAIFVEIDGKAVEAKRELFDEWMISSFFQFRCEI